MYNALNMWFMAHQQTVVAWTVCSYPVLVVLFIKYHDRQSRKGGVR